MSVWGFCKWAVTVKAANSSDQDKIIDRIVYLFRSGIYTNGNEKWADADKKTAHIQLEN